MKEKHVKRIIVLVFLFLVMGSIWYQAFFYDKMQNDCTLYQKMKADCSFLEVSTLREDMQVFPVRKDKTGKEKYAFENGYGAPRSYGGKRVHQGIDVMTSNNKPGYFQVQSVSEGTVEQIGWLKLGGYRIGVRSRAGYYYYYAHLDSYASGIKKGKKIHAGDLLGTMGNTGYGKEGTKGKFDVHLHFGIYCKKNEKEKSLNPYYLLRSIT